VLGSTGSIGRQTLEVASALGIRVAALAAGRNIKLLEEQVRLFKPDIAAVYDEDTARDFKVRIGDLGVKVCAGGSGLVEAACVEGAGTVVTATAGTAGLLPTIEAIRLGRRIALANKETLVCAGALVMGLAQRHGAEIIPVDSEHSAIFQCIGAAAEKTVKRIILTASGGPFRGLSREELAAVTPEMALRHPTWSMGDKITIDSATMMNKGLEIIEAVHLFKVSPDMVEVVVHPESIVHSMVEFVDNSVVAQLAAPDMRLPIQYALTFPERRASLAKALDFAGAEALRQKSAGASGFETASQGRMGAIGYKAAREGTREVPGATRQGSAAEPDAAPNKVVASALHFEAPDISAFPCLGLAMEAARMGGTACAVLNGANEAAVELFLRGELGFYGISESVRRALDGIAFVAEPSLGDIVAAGDEARRMVFGE